MLKISRFHEFKPYLSLGVIFFSLFFILVPKMEMRRKGYVVLKKGKYYRELKDRKRRLEMEYAQYLSLPSLTKKAEKKLDLHQAEGGQIIQMSGPNIAVNK